jgi:hypothetical protein
MGDMVTQRFKKLDEVTEDLLSQQSRDVFHAHNCRTNFLN